MTIAGHELEWPQGLSFWLQTAVSAFSVLGAVLMIGVWIGPVGKTPDKVTLLESKVRDLEFRKEMLEKQGTQLEQRQNDSAEDRRRLHESIQKAETLAADIKANSLTRIEFVEWKAALENRNKNLSAPPLVIKEK